MCRYRDRPAAETARPASEPAKIPRKVRTIRQRPDMGETPEVHHECRFEIEHDCRLATRRGL
jgi:hypothetical protein